MAWSDAARAAALAARRAHARGRSRAVPLQGTGAGQRLGAASVSPRIGRRALAKHLHAARNHFKGMNHPGGVRGKHYIVRTLAHSTAYSKRRG